MKQSQFVVLIAVILTVVALRLGFYYYHQRSGPSTFSGPKILDYINGAPANASTSVIDKLQAMETSPQKADLDKEKPIAKKTNLKPANKGVKRTNLELANALTCNDTEWCNILPPTESMFSFKDAPNDPLRWKIAQIQAANGEQILLERIVKSFPNSLDYIDGDASFRKFNYPADHFHDRNRDFTFLTKPLSTIPTNPSHFGAYNTILKEAKEKKLPRLAAKEKEAIINKAQESMESATIRRSLLEQYDWEKQGKVVIPPLYDTQVVGRAPIIKLGYFAYSMDGRARPFDGPQLQGEAGISLAQFLDKWKDVKDRIQTPFIAMHGSNENWGILSTFFPNRTVDWGRCCDGREKDLLEFLNHNKTLMFFVSQHSNISHPKLITMPRGIPVFTPNLNRVIWDTQRILLKSQPKNQLAFTASSKWGPRPQVIACIRKKFSDKEFQGASYGDNQQGRIDQPEYYRRLGTARTGIALSGLGHDTFRLWETLTMGTMPVMERGFGLDKTVWKLPCFIVDDFDLVTPALLRQAYVEALYRVDEFEFERLHMSWWFSFLSEVSTRMDVQAVYDKFPPEGEQSDFARPWEPFTCWKSNSCGAGTKRIPKTSC